jgi:hypothetical protein
MSELKKKKKIDVSIIYDNTHEVYWLRWRQFIRLENNSTPNVYNIIKYDFWRIPFFFLSQEQSTRSTDDSCHPEESSRQEPLIVWYDYTDSNIIILYSSIRADDRRRFSAPLREIINYMYYARGAGQKAIGSHSHAVYTYT